MLYDPKWDKKVSLAGFVAWLETKDPSTTYDWTDCRGACLIGQYIQFLGADEFSEDSKYSIVCRKLFGVWDGGSLPQQSVASNLPHTFGAALARARAWQSRC